MGKIMHFMYRLVIIIQTFLYLFFFIHLFTISICFTDDLLLFFVLSFSNFSAFDFLHITRQLNFNNQNFDSITKI